MSSDDAVIGLGSSVPRWTIPYSVSIPKVLAMAIERTLVTPRRYTRSDASSCGEVSGAVGSSMMRRR